MLWKQVKPSYRTPLAPNSAGGPAGRRVTVRGISVTVAAAT